MGWYVHAMVYLAVNTVLMLIAFGTGRNWAIFPALGWGLGLLLHGLGVWLSLGGGGPQQRLIDRNAPACPASATRGKPEFMMHARLRSCLAAFLACSAPWPTPAWV
jgi:hypothetical protein